MLVLVKLNYDRLKFLIHDGIIYFIFMPDVLNLPSN